jgi:hypothetical protein
LIVDTLEPFMTTCPSSQPVLMWESAMFPQSSLASDDPCMTLLTRYVSQVLQPSGDSQGRLRGGKEACANAEQVQPGDVLGEVWVVTEMR